MPGPTQTSTRQRTRVTVSRDALTAMLVLHAPNPGEPDLTLEEIHADLAKAGVTFGVDEEAIAAALQANTLNTPIQIAKGVAPIKGENAKFAYAFDPSNNHCPFEDKLGHIDYKQLNFIQNAAKDQILATKTPPTAGVAGKNVYGEDVPALAGRDLPFRSGVNTCVSEDGLTLHAAASGAIVYKAGEISVKDVMVISGDLDHNVGNVECLGSLKVTGDIKAGYSICADGDLEVNGNVEDSTILVKGNIMIKGGFFGNSAGVLHADGNITVKFAEGQRITAGGDITVGGELINCNVIAKGSVFVKGKRGKIIGGEVRAEKEIRAAVLGSDAGTFTVLAVAFDADMMRQYYQISKEVARLKADSQRIKDALYGLYRLQMDGKLSAGQAEALKKLEAFQKDLPTNLESLEKQKSEIEEKTRELRDARIIADEILYPGVRAQFGLIYRDIVQEVRSCKLMIEGYQVVMSEVSPSR